jgi:putative flippase GtrA
VKIIQSHIDKAQKAGLFKYLLVGGSAFIVEYGSFYTLFSLLGVQVYVANTVSFCGGFIISFIFNRTWSFKKDEFKRQKHQQFIMYIVLALLNLLLSNIIIGSLKRHGLDPLIGKVVVMGLIVGWNFFLFKLVIFAGNQTKD